MDKLSRNRLKHFGLHLAQLRKSQGMSLRNLALKSGVDHKKISDIELNKRGLKLETLFKLADGLGMHPGKLIDFDFLENK